jgi:[FeFe] hydrogenase H-cluster maturation GTPase HydF
MTMETPLAESASIVVVGLRNAGKSSLINNIFGKDVAIVSPVPGTTTDPVVRKMELPQWGPVAFVDTPGIDDEGDLGRQRVGRTESRLASAAAVVFATAGHRDVAEPEKQLLARLEQGTVPYLIVVTHGDLPLSEGKKAWVADKKHLVVSNYRSDDGAALRLAVAGLAEGASFEAAPLDGLVREGDHILLVTPIDLAAPKGRLIQPQVETIRDALDKDCRVTVVKERELYDTYRSFNHRPTLVITDSQAFSKVAADIDEDQPLTSFSILFARKKGELEPFLRGLGALSRFQEGHRVFVMEACSHHRGADDIASVKIPRLFARLVSPDVRFETVRRIPQDLTPQDLVIHCAACMMTSAAFKARLASLTSQGVPVTNYGLFLAWANGLLPRAIEPFPEYREAYHHLWQALYSVTKIKF